MAPTAISRSTRYFDPALTKCYYLPTVAATTLVPTRAEMNAGKDLTAEIADLMGWQVASDQLDTPDMGSRYISKIGGRTHSKDSSITFYADQTGTDIRAVLPRGTVGYIMWCDGGDVAGSKGDVYPVTVIANAQERSIKEAARRMVEFSVTSQPAESITIPA